MTARIITLPRTRAGRELLREVARFIGGWGKPGGPALEEFDWDASALEEQRWVDNPPEREAR